MDDPTPIILIVFPVFFIAIWLAATTILGVASGWRALQEHFPDRDDEVLETFRMASGVMGAVNMKNVLTLTACRSGLRVSIWRIFGLFSRPFFVPWDQLAIEREQGLLGQRAIIRLGSPEVGKLQIAASLADRLADAGQGRWPERTSVQRTPTVS